MPLASHHGSRYGEGMSAGTDGKSAVDTRANTWTSPRQMVFEEYFDQYILLHFASSISL